jgi:phage-related protein
MKSVPAIKPLIWVGGCKKDLLAMPDEVQDLFGFALLSGSDQQEA